jgi:hypothetical protein
MKHGIGTRWFATPYGRSGHFSHDFQSSYIWITYLLSTWRFSCLCNDNIVPPFLILFYTRPSRIEVTVREHVKNWMRKWHGILYVQKRIVSGDHPNFVVWGKKRWPYQNNQCISNKIYFCKYLLVANINILMLSNFLPKHYVLVYVRFILCPMTKA